MRALPSFAEVSAVLSYDPKTGALRWLTPSNRDRNRAGKIAGREKPDKGGKYVVVSLGRRSIGAHRIAWLLMTGAWPDREVDHRNRQKHDNRWSNLRAASRAENNANIPGRGASGRKGVRWHKKTQKWNANITVSGRTRSLGYFDSLDAAASAYETAAKSAFGEFAV